MQVPRTSRTCRTSRTGRICLLLCAVFVLTSAQSLPRRTQWADVTPYAESLTAHAGSTVRLVLKVDIAKGFHIQSNHPKGESAIGATLALDTPEGVRYVDAAFPPAADFRLTGIDDVYSVFEGTILVGVRVAITKDLEPGAISIPARFRYQACDDRLCYFPATQTAAWSLQVVPAGQPVTLQHQDIFKKVDFGRAEAVAQGDGSRSREARPVPASSVPAPPQAPATSLPPATDAQAADEIALFDQFEVVSGPKGFGYMDVPAFLAFLNDAETGVKSRGPFEGQGPLAILAIVFLGGLALNLTPCVLPMIPINLAIIGAGAQSKKRSRGFALGGAYGAAMALVYGVLGVIVILTAGTFGAINSTVWFNVAIALLFVVLGLAMFDVISIDFSRWSSKVKFDASSRGTFFLAFGMGALAAVLAGACVAPVVIQVVIFSSNLYAKGASIALALPFVLGLGMALPWPIAGAGIASLPKPGAWMVRVKQALGVFILGTAVYYGYVAYQIIASRSAAASVAAGESPMKDGWHTSLVSGLQAAKRDGTPVFIDFWATWCKDCLVMDKTTLQDPAVKAALEKYTRIKFESEDIGVPPVATLLEKIGSPGLPTYVVLRAR